MHLAIIMDGNGRYGKNKYGVRSLGHKDGAEKLYEICKWCPELNVDYLTVYAFSTENWKRSKEEVDFLMKLFEDMFHKYILESKENNMKIFKVSAVTGQGMKELMIEVSKILKTLPKEELIEEKEAKKVYKLEDEEPFTITKEDDMYVVDGPAIRELMRKVNMEDNESLYYFQKNLDILGVNQKLKEAGVKDGDTVKVYDYILEWED